MKKKLLALIFFIFISICSCKVIFAANQYNYSAISAWGTLVSGIGTLLAVIVALATSILLPKHKNLQAELVLDRFDNKLKLIIVNTGNAPIILRKIDFLANNLFFHSVGLIFDYYVPVKSTTVINTGSSLVITSEKLGNICSFEGHLFNINNKNKNYLVIIRIQDFASKKFNCKTNVTLGQLYDFINDINEQKCFDKKTSTPA